MMPKSAFAVAGWRIKLRGTEGNLGSVVRFDEGARPDVIVRPCRGQHSGGEAPNAPDFTIYC